MAYNLELADSIKNYIEQNKDVLATKTAMTADSTKYFNIQTGVLAETEIHTLETELAIQDASTCGFSPLGSQKISGRKLVPSFLKINAEYCAKDFLKTIYNKQTSIAMGRGELPLEEQFVKDILDNIKVENERLLWSGDKNDGDLMDGITTIAKADGNVNTFTSTKTSLIDRLQELYATVDMNGYVVFCSMVMYKGLINELLEKNYLVAGYAEDNAEHIIQMPASGIKVIGIEGIASDDENFYVFKPEDMFMGVDGTNDVELFDLFFSQDNRTYRLDIEWVLAVNYLFSERVYIYGVE